MLMVPTAYKNWVKINCNFSKSKPESKTVLVFLHLRQKKKNIFKELIKNLRNLKINVNYGKDVK